MRRAFITGITGQDGSYLAELLLAKGYEVHGLIRRSSSTSTSRIAHLLDRLQLHEGDLLDAGGLAAIVSAVKPDETYNLGGQSFVPASFAAPVYTAEATGLGAVKLLEAIRQNAPACRFYQASTSELYGSTPPPQSETTRFHPRSPYGVAKLLAHTAVVNYREAYSMHASSGILFNHESPRRGVEFVTRKITRGVADIKHGRAKELRLGNLDAKRDWGHARDYVYAMWLMLQQPAPDDYVIATGETHTIREFCEAAFSYTGLVEDYVVVDEKFYRPAEVNALCGDASKARRALGWRPEVSFKALVREMVDADLKALSR